MNNKWSSGGWGERMSLRGSQWTTENPTIVSKHLLDALNPRQEDKRRRTADSSRCRLSEGAEPPLHRSSASVRPDEHLGACLFSQAQKLADADILQQPVVPRLHSHGPISSASLPKYMSLCRRKESAGFMSLLTAHIAHP